MHGFGFGSFGWISMLLNLVITIGVILGIVLLIVWLIRKVAPDGFGPSGWTSDLQTPASPREILQARYAKGEITREQYKEILTDLT